MDGTQDLGSLGIWDVFAIFHELMIISLFCVRGFSNSRKVNRSRLDFVEVQCLWRPALVLVQHCLALFSAWVTNSPEALP